MTAGNLTFIIFGVILAQVMIATILVFYRHKREYRELNTHKTVQTPVSTQSPQISKFKTEMLVSEPSWEGFKEFSVQRREFEDNKQSICSFYLIPLDGKSLPVFKPGQYLTFKLLIKDPVTHESKNVVRCYSLSDAPRPDYYRISVKRVPAPASQPDVPYGLSSNFFHDHVQQGSKVLVKAPSGHFHLMANEHLPIVLIGGGIGITPMLSILNSLIEHISSREIWFFYGIRNSYEQIMKVPLQLFAKDINNLHVQISYSQPLDTDREGIDYQHKGRIDIPLLRSTLKLERYQFYVCGPQSMMESIVPGLGDWGVDSNDIFYESFGPATLIQHEKFDPTENEVDVPDYKVSFSESGTQVAWDHNASSLLEFVESQGIEVESGCRAGSCGSCQTKVIAGEVDYNQDPDADVAPGHCLLCISKPQNNLTLEL